MKKRKNFKSIMLIAGVAIVLAAGFLYAYFIKSKKDIVVTKPTNTPTPTESAAVFPSPYVEEKIFVYVCGAVKESGLYEMPKGSRGLNAVEMAGGFAEGADRDYLNLAAVLTDGQRLYIPFLKDTESISPGDRIEGGDGEHGAVGTVSKVNINTAGVEELMTLSGIGEARAKDIIAYRTKVGAFLTIEEIMNVSGIGESRFEKIKDSIRVN